MSTHSPVSAALLTDANVVVTRLYRQHAAGAFKLALRYSRGDRQWAEDLVHDVFLEVHRNALRLATMENAGGWIYRATTSRCLNRLRRERFLRSPWVRWILPQPQSTPDPEVMGAARDELGQVFAAVNALPDKQRLCFWMYHVDGLTQPEIGEVLGIKKSYVCKLLKRAEIQIEHLQTEADRE